MKTKTRQRAMNMDVWERTYEVVEANPGCIEMSQYSEVADKDPHYVWTVVEAKDGRNRSYILPGFHIVNVLGYLVTRKPWTDADDASGLSVLWD